MTVLPFRKRIATLSNELSSLASVLECVDTRRKPLGFRLFLSPVALPLFVRGFSQVGCLVYPQLLPSWSYCQMSTGRQKDSWIGLAEIGVRAILG